MGQQIMRWEIVTLLLLALIARQAVAGERFAMQATEVASNVYAVITPVRTFPNPQNRGWNANSAFVVTEEGVLLFDSGSSSEIGTALRALIATVTDRPVRWIVNSHDHGDHWLGNAAFADLRPEILATAYVQKRVKEGGERWVTTFKQMTDGVTGDTPILAPTRRVDQPTTLTLGGVPVQLLPAAGHTPGDLMVWLPVQRVLLSGDLVYANRMPSTNAGDLRGWIVELGRLQQLNPEVVVPGHGDLTDAAGLQRLERLLRALWEAVKAGYAAGLADYEMVERVTVALAPFHATFPGMAEKLRRDIPHLYLQVEAAAFD